MKCVYKSISNDPGELILQFLSRQQLSKSSERFIDYLITREPTLRLYLHSQLFYQRI